MESSQIESIKKQLIQQISSNFPEDKKFEAIEKVKLMNPQELEEFLIKNKLVKTGELEQEAVQKCIFCTIIKGEIPTNKIDENKVAIATLEINPISKGHSIIIPKEHIETSTSLPSQAFSLAKKISKKIKSKLKPKEIVINSANILGHEIINVLPIYKDESIGSPRKQAKPEELDNLKKLLESKLRKKSVKKPKIEKASPEPKLWLNPRIP